MAKGYYRDIVIRLRANGFAFSKQAKGSHQKWRDKTGTTVIVPNPCKSLLTANAILKSAGIDEKL